MAGYNHFDYVPSTTSSKRSVFKFDKHIATSGEVGYLYPMCAPVRMLPGSSLKLDFACEVRSGALIAPLMNEFVMDVFSFLVPNRIVWEHWKQFLGATDDVLFDNLTDYTIPNFSYCGVDPSINSAISKHVWNHMKANYFELPYMTQPDDADSYEKISALPFRGYDFIWNEFFRPEQLVDPILFSKTDAGYSGDNMICTPMGITWNGVTNGYYVIGPYANVGDNPISGGCVLPTFRVHKSLWTSCLPKPSLETLNLLGDLSAPVGFIASSSGTTGGSAYPYTPTGVSYNTGDFVPNTAVSGVNGVPAVDLSQAILTVNNYRETIMLQNYYNSLNRTGSRYDTIIKALFHTIAPEAVIDIPELITHKRFTIYRKQVVATASTNYGASDANTQVLGQQGAYIDTVVSDSFFTKSTTEHGYIHMLWTIRPLRIMMSNGIEPMWQQLEKFDQYYSCFDGMGDVPRYKKEIYVPASTVAGQGIFGYQEYGAEYKYQRSSATGDLGAYHPNNLSIYTLAEKLSSQPTLATSGLAGYNSYISCLVESEALSRVLAISNPMLAPQFILDIRLTGEIVHPMPVYNIPGMGDLL